jgi:hypothetical protein
LGQDSSSRKIVWVEGQNLVGCDCSECAWVFSPSGPPIGETVAEVKQNCQMQLPEEFA